MKELTEREKSLFGPVPAIPITLSLYFTWQKANGNHQVKKDSIARLVNLAQQPDEFSDLNYCDYL
jgi:hypothetical protein